jgi:diguanylate cyclase (GGDEF)-like protein
LLEELHVLVIDDEESPVPDSLAPLEEAGAVTLEWARDLATGVTRLDHGGVDVVLLGLSLPDCVGPATFERAQLFAADVPFVVVAGPAEEAWARRTRRLGAADVLEHGELASELIVRVLRHAVERHRLLVALRQMAAIDDQTRLYNRRGLFELAASHLKVARRMSRDLVLLHVDVEGLGGVNQVHGEAVGDDLLMATAQVLRTVFRGSDLVARVGGDEFAVLAHDARESDVPAILRRLDAALANQNGTGRIDAPLRVTVGFATLQSGFPVTVEAWLEQAASGVIRHRLTGEASRPGAR